MSYVITDNPKGSEQKDTSELVLRKADNGGWTISQIGQSFESSRTIGAYSNANDMIEALKASLASD